MHVMNSQVKKVQVVHEWVGTSLAMHGWVENPLGMHG